MTVAICGFITFIVYSTWVVFLLLSAFLVLPVFLLIGAGILGAIVYGGRADDDTRPTENTREW